MTWSELEAWVKKEIECARARRDMAYDEGIKQFYSGQISVLSSILRDVSVATHRSNDPEDKATNVVQLKRNK